MRFLSIISALLAVLLLSAFSITQQMQWGIADDYVISFSGGASGSFSELEGEINFDPAKLEASTMDVSVNVATISTGNDTKDKHAKNKSWLDLEAFPKIRFVSKRFEKQGENYVVFGDLTLHGISKEIEIPFTFSETGEGGLFEGDFSIMRKDYGIKGPFMGFAVGNRFDISLKVPVTK